MARKIRDHNGLDADEEYAKRFGVSYREYQAYKAQKNNARRRGIDFAFTPSSWATWWSLNLPAGERRGRKRDEYVMARKADRGSYAWDNVYVSTQGQNATVAMTPEVRLRIGNANRGHPAPHLAAGASHPRSRVVATPDGIFGNATLAAQHYGITRQHAAYRARTRFGGWKYA